MKKILWIALIRLSLLPVIAACSQAGQETLPGMEQGETGPTAQQKETEPATAPNYCEPFSEAEYSAWSLGTALSIDGIEDAYYNHEAEGAVYHRIYNQTFDVMEFAPRALYHYDSFYTYTNENVSKKPVYFHGNTALYLHDDTDAEMPFPDEETLVNIQDPAIFGLLEEFVFSLTFEAGGEKPSWAYNEVLFITRGIDKTETTYTIYRDGTVFRNETHEATQKLSEDVTAAIFAVKYAYTRSAKTHVYYAMADMDFAPEFAGYGLVQVKVDWNGQELLLTVEESREFLRLLSDPNGDDNTYITYRCFLRSNCGMGDRGEKLLNFTLIRVYEDGSEDPMWTYSLYEDGKVVYKDKYYMEYRGSHVSILDQLLVDRYIISRSNFDTQAILDFLNS